MRPDPDALLKHVQQEEPSARRRGRLKVFLGACAGVGKTYEMLREAIDLQAQGVDVVAGYVEPHGRAETERMLEHLETVPMRQVTYRGVVLREFDLDAALARRPALLLVDELAHTNAPESRHARRWQDVMELLAAGIDVYTTVNIQHVESQSDVVAAITGARVHETVPDSLLEAADKVELVDLPPEELLARLAAGKVYVPEQAGQAVQHFFRRGNLIALRQLALRYVADRIDVDMDAYRLAHAISPTWPVNERLLVCVSPSPSSAALVRAAKRLAGRLAAPWLAVYVEPPEGLSDPARDRVNGTLALAERLGAETAVLGGGDAVREIVAFARRRNVTRIVAGKPTHSRWRDRLRGSFVEDLVRLSGEMDVHVTRGEDEPERRREEAPRRSAHGMRYARSALLVAAATGVCALLAAHFGPVNLVMVYLLAVAVAAVYGGRGPSALATLLSVATFDYLFVPPRYSFSVSDTEYLFTFAVMLGVGLLISTLAARVRSAAEAARDRERRTAALYDLARDLASTYRTADLLKASVKRMSDVFETPAVTLIPDDEGQLVEMASAPTGLVLDPKEAAVARWAYDHGQTAGRATDTLPLATGLYVPLTAQGRTLGVLGLQWPPENRTPLRPDQMRLLELFAGQIAEALHRSDQAAWFFRSHPHNPDA